MFVFVCRYVHISASAHICQKTEFDPGARITGSSQLLNRGAGNQTLVL